MADEQPEPVLTDAEKEEQYHVLADSFGRWTAALPVQGLRNMLAATKEYEGSTQIERDMLALVFSMTKMLSWIIPADNQKDEDEPWK